MWWIVGILIASNILLWTRSQVSFYDTAKLATKLMYHRTHEHLSNEIIQGNIRITVPPGTEEDFGY